MVILPVIGQEHVSERIFPDFGGHFLQGEAREIEKCESMADSQVLEKEGLILLHQKDPWPKDVPEQLFSEDELL